MSNVSFIGYKVSEITFINKYEQEARIELENKYSYNLNYLPDNKTCIGKFIVEITDKIKSDKFLIKIELSGVFNYKEDITQENIHLETYKELFPYVRALITTITCNCGMPPLVIPNVDVDAQKIQKN